MSLFCLFYSLLFPHSAQLCLVLHYSINALGTVPLICGSTQGNIRKSGAEREQELIYWKTRERGTISIVLRRVSRSSSPQCLPSIFLPPLDKTLINSKLSSPSFPVLNALMGNRFRLRLQATFWPIAVLCKGVDGVHSLEKRHLGPTCKVRLYIAQQITNGIISRLLSSLCDGWKRRHLKTFVLETVKLLLMGNSRGSCEMSVARPATWAFFWQSGI